ncbi:MAG TPA: Lpg1974 family pore-forming outer membrane protein [Gemmatales bacterium]|nr:Lpg1974 family pore-forming outer membrane protein [Gemmatales bacterium]
MHARSTCWAALAAVLVTTAALAQGNDPLAPRPQDLPSPLSHEVWPTVLDGPQGVEPLWPEQEEGLPVFVSIEGQLLVPKLQRWSTSSIVGAEVLRHPRNFTFDWTLAPEVTLGYQLSQHVYLMGRYRFIDMTGRRERPADFASIYWDAAQDILGLGDGDPFFAGLRTQRAEMTFNVFDLGLAAMDLRSPTGSWRFELAARFTSVTSRIDSVWYNQQPVLGPGINEIPLLGVQQASMRFDGIGPQLAIETVVPLLPNLNFFGRVEGGLIFGEAEHSYGHVIDLVNLQHYATGITDGPSLVPNLRAQLGFNWQWYLGCTVFELTAGYMYEKWWFIGAEDDLGHRGYYPSIDLSSHGPFVRAMLRF